jgi:hypothetical protein
MTTITQSQAKLLLSAKDDGAPHESYGDPEPLVSLGLLHEAPYYDLTPRGRALVARFAWVGEKIVIR